MTFPEFIIGVGILFFTYMLVIRPILALCDIPKELEKLTKELQKLNKSFDEYVKNTKKGEEE